MHRTKSSIGEQGLWKKGCAPESCCARFHMDMTNVPPDFKEFLSLLNSKGVEYLLIGGYAVWCYGYVRPTDDMDVWIATSPDNAASVIEALVDFGFERSSLSLDRFTVANKITRMGRPPMRLEVLTGISGVDFVTCYANKETANVDGMPVPVINLKDLMANKEATGRLKDLNDVEYLSGRKKQRRRTGG